MNFKGCEIFNKRKALMFLVRTSRKDDKPSRSNAIEMFSLKRSTNQEIVIFEALIGEYKHPYGHTDTCVLSTNGEQVEDVFYSYELTSLDKLNGTNDGSSKIEIRGNTIFTDKVGSWIGKKGDNVKKGIIRIIIDYFGRI